MVVVVVVVVVVVENQTTHRLSSSLHLKHVDDVLHAMPASGREPHECISV